MPDWVRFLRQRLNLPAMGDRHDERIIRELSDHLEEVYREALSTGATEEAAEATALTRLGDPEHAGAQLRATEPDRVRNLVSRWLANLEDRLRTKGSLWTLVADCVGDLRLAIRSLLRRPLFTAVAVFVLAVGIGATTTIFTLLDAIILSPLPFEDANRLVSVSHTAPGLGIQDLGQCAAWHVTYEDEQLFETLGMYRSRSSTVQGYGEPEVVPSMDATSGVFRALRVQPVVGRIFRAEDESPESPAVVLAGHRFWQTRLGGDPHVVGRSIQVDGESFTIVGVLPPTIRSLGTDPSLVFAFRIDRSTLYVGDWGFRGIARLRDDATVEEARAAATRILPLASEAFPGGPVADFAERAEFAPSIAPLRETLVASVAGLLWIVMAGVGIVLLIACANVATLLLVRAEGRHTEMAVRAALGAGPRRVTWEYLKESLVLGLLGGAAGLVLALLGLRLLLAMGPDTLPRMQEASLNAHVLLFTLVISLGAGVAVGMSPALKYASSQPMESLKLAGPSGMPGRQRRRVRSAMAVGQVALAIILLLASGFMLRSFTLLHGVDPGFSNPEEVLTFRLFLPVSDVPELEQVATTHESIAHRLEEIPGVHTSTLATSLPMTGSGISNPVYLEGEDNVRREPVAVHRHKWIGGGFLETLQIPLRLGRTITWRDVHQRTPVVLVSESMARRYWGSPSAALGKGLAIRPEPPRWHKVVGVVADVHEDGLGAEPPLMIYWPYVTLAQWEGDPEEAVTTWRSAAFALRSANVDRRWFVNEVRRAIHDAYPDLPLRNIRCLDELTSETVARGSYATVLLCLAACVAFGLGLVGVYGAVSYSADQRRCELGMRIALGARRHDVTWMLVRHGMLIGGIGLVIGVALAVALTRLLFPLLPGTSPRDPITFVVVPIAVLAATLVASYVPARKTALLDPMAALRGE